MIPTTLFESNNYSLLALKLLKNLKPDKWPIEIDDFPLDTALVGGAVRDGLLDKHNSITDLDFVVTKNAIKTCKYFAQKYGGTVVELDPKRDIGRYVISDWKIDIASQIGKNLEEDLLRRDFSINSIALKLIPNPCLIDPSGGLQDLRKKKLVAISEQNLIDDPLRILRGFRFMSELNFAIDQQTLYFFTQNSNLLNKVASERIKVEIERLLEGDSFDDVIPLLLKIKLLEAWEEKTNKYKFNFRSLNNVSSFRASELKLALPLIRLTNLLSEEGLMKLGFSRKTIRNCNLLKKWQNRNVLISSNSLNEGERLKLHIELEKLLPALILTLPPKEQKIWLNRWRNPYDPLFHPYSPLDGSTLQKLLKETQGPWIGQLMHHLCKERAFGRLQNRSEAITFARYWWQHNQPFCD